MDFASDVTQSNLITTVPGPYTFASNANLVADVQGWANNSNNNFGWILISELEGVGSTEVKFGSREDTTNAPVLTIQYTLPATPPTLVILAPTNGIFRFAFNTESNHGYIVEHAGALPTSNWNVLLVLDSATFSSNATVTDPLTSSNRFYRVRTQ